MKKYRRQFAWRMLAAVGAAVLAAAVLAGAGAARTHHAAKPAVSGNIVLAGWASSEIGRASCRERVYHPV